MQWAIQATIQTPKILDTWTKDPCLKGVLNHWFKQEANLPGSSKDLWFKCQKSLEFSALSME